MCEGVFDVEFGGGGGEIAAMTDYIFFLAV